MNAAEHWLLRTRSSVSHLAADSTASKHGAAQKTGRWARLFETTGLESLGMPAGSN